MQLFGVRLIGLDASTLRKALLSVGFVAAIVIVTVLLRVIARGVFHSRDASASRQYPISRSLSVEPHLFYMLTDNRVQLAVRFVARIHGTRELKEAISAISFATSQRRRSPSLRRHSRSWGCRNSMWTAKRILKELADSTRRNRILQSFWKHAEPASRLVASAQLAKALHFREETLKKMPLEKRADLLASRIGVPEFDQFFEAALLTYHTHHANEMMAAFLDRWGVPHANGSIEADEYKVPAVEDVRNAVGELTAFDRRDVALYLASAGLLMGDEWRAATWPVVDEIATVV